ncbi:trypsin-like peptidase domain-containing protein [Candidatus Micrarchaeota archaeon]|nr:trypsin-like peptidase domain-containing protein [Candidatus Micrarchaeota archaeon]
MLLGLQNLALVAVVLLSACIGFYPPVDGSTGEPAADSGVGFIDEAKKSIVYIRNDVTGCCDSYNQTTVLLGGAGSGVVIMANASTGEVFVVTSRHVVDCVFSGGCLYPVTEEITVRTQDGKFYSPAHVYHMAGNLDMAVIQFVDRDGNVFPARLPSKNYSAGDGVVAIGYPAIGLASPEPILKFTTTSGEVNNVYNLLTYRGLSFTAIQSDALTDQGSSGGGLFNTEGELLGVVTWGSRDDRITIAIGVDVLIRAIQTNSSLESCDPGKYQVITGECCDYGTIYGNDGLCHRPCGGVYYCSVGSTCFGDECLKCEAGYRLGDDGKCYPE